MNIRGKLILGIIFFLLIYPNIIYATKQEENEALLEEYINNGYNSNILEQRNSLLSFQAHNNLDVDGIIGENTLKAIKSKNKKAVDIVSEELREKKWMITINKTKKILTVYKNGKAYNKYPVALGRGDSPTPDHKFTVINKIVNPHWGGMGGKYTPIEGGAKNNPLGKRWLGLSTEKHIGYGIHGNASPFSIGKYISNGCIRMINEDVEELFEYIPLNTEVWIGTEEILEKWGVQQLIEYQEEVVTVFLIKPSRWQRTSFMPMR